MVVLPSKETVLSRGCDRTSADYGFAFCNPKRERWAFCSLSLADASGYFLQSVFTSVNNPGVCACLKC